MICYSKVFEGVTFSMACDFELKHRKTNQDFRRQLFSKQEELLGTDDQKWGNTSTRKSPTNFSEVSI